MRREDAVKRIVGIIGVYRDSERHADDLLRRLHKHLTRKATPETDQKLLREYEQLKALDYAYNRYYVPNHETFNYDIFVPFQTEQGGLIYQRVNDICDCIIEIGYTRTIRGTVLTFVVANPTKYEPRYQYTGLKDWSISIPVDRDMLRLFDEMERQQALRARQAKSHDIEIADLEVYNPYSKGYDRVL